MLRPLFAGLVALLVLVLLPPAAHAADVTSLSPATATLSGRVIASGTGFGATQAGGSVTVGGVPAIVTRWSDTSIRFYVPESAPLGLTTVKVTAADGSTALGQLEVTTRPPAGDRILWRFEMDSLYTRHRVGIGADGTIYANDVAGFTYALAPNGALKWVYKGPAGSGSTGPVAVGSDGTVYVAADWQIHAINPDGTRKWVFSDDDSQGIIAGPSIGPDGNIYAATDIGPNGTSLGVIALSPAGQLLWSNPGNPRIGETAQAGQEIAFGSGRLYVAFDGSAVSSPHLFGFGLSGSQDFAVSVPDEGTPVAGANGAVHLASVGGGLRTFDANGELLWRRDAAGFIPSVAPSGNLYAVTINQGARLTAFTPQGTELWSTPATGLLFDPVVSPSGDLTISGGRLALGDTGYLKGVGADGSVLWEERLPFDGAFCPVPSSRAKFHPDGSVAYIAAELLCVADPDHSWLYAVRPGTGTAEPAPPPPPPAETTTTTFSGKIDKNQTKSHTLTLDVTGTVSLGLDWDDARVNLALRALDPSGNVVLLDTGSAKPKSGSFSTTATGTYRLEVINTTDRGVDYTLTATHPVSSSTTAALSSLSLEPTSVTGGTSSRGTVTLSAAAPSGGAVVGLSSSSSIAAVPASVTVPAGSTSASFDVATTAVTASTSSTISATWEGVTRTATLTVIPPGTTADTVTVGKAEYDTGKSALRVEATSSSAGATLSVYITSTGEFVGTLSDGKGEFVWPTAPSQITVESSGGGSSTASVAIK